MSNNMFRDKQKCIINNYPYVYFGYINYNNEEESLLKNKCHSGGQETNWILSNSKFRYRNYKFQPLKFILNHCTPHIPVRVTLIISSHTSPHSKTLAEFTLSVQNYSFTVFNVHTINKSKTIHRQTLIYMGYTQDKYPSLL